MQLFPYQEEGAQWLSERRRALLLDEPGLGKTAQVLRAADYVGATSQGVICPASIATQWGRAHRDISLAPSAAFGACSYERARDRGVEAFHTLTLDEVHYLKNPNSGRTVAILGRERYGVDGAIFNSQHVWGLSGTLAPRDPFDLYPVMWGLVPESLRMHSGRMMSQWQFLRQYCVMKEFKKGQGNHVLRGKNLEELKERLAPYMLRRTKKQVFKDWKEPVCAELWLDADDVADKMRVLDRTPEGQLLADIFTTEGFEGLNAFAETDNGISRLRRLTGLLKVGIIVSWLKDQWDAGMGKVVIMCVHRDVIEELAAALEREDVESVTYWGGLSSAEQEKRKSRFVTNARFQAFIGQIDACGTGLDGIQHVASRMVFAEWSWIGDQNYQALCRLDRIGQEEPVLGQFVGLQGSLDAAIMATATRRTAEGKTLFG